MELLLNIGDITVTGETRIFRKEICSGVTLFATNPTCTRLGSNMGLCGKTPKNSRYSLARPLNSTNF